MNYLKLLIIYTKKNNSLKNKKKDLPTEQYKLEDKKLANKIIKTIKLHKYKGV